VTDPKVIQGTLAVVVTWLCVWAMLAGCGHLTRRCLLAMLSQGGPRTLSRADLWIGLAALVGYLQLWTLAFRIDAWTWVAPALAGLAGLVIGGRRPRVRLPTPRALGAVCTAAVGILWLANESFGVPGLYDFALYHLNVIEYAERFPAIPGIASLQIRLGASDPHLLIAAMLDQGPWAGAGFQLVTGLLEGMLFIDIACRLGSSPQPTTFTNRMAVLVGAGTALTIGISTQHWLAAPNLDTGALIVVSAGLLYLAETVERGSAFEPALAATGALAVASATRPLYWPTAFFASALVGVLAHRRSSLGVVRSAVLGCALPAVIAAGWMARQAVLSGYPFFPLPIAGLSVDWRTSLSIVEAQNHADLRFARSPEGAAPGSLLGSWHWLASSWLPRRRNDLLVILPLTLFACALPFLIRSGPDTGRPQRLRPMLAVLVPAVGTLLVWFLLLPDPRFALAPIWLVPIALVAWALPSPGPGRGFLRALGILELVLVGAAVGVVLAWVWKEQRIWVVPTALGAWAVILAATRVARARGVARHLGYAAVTSALVAGLWIVASLQAFETWPASGPGPFGSPGEPTPAVTSVVTRSGLRLVEPVGSDQCWGTILCAPSPDPRLRLRGKGIADGFTLGPG
jgi:hypothetical protein